LVLLRARVEVRAVGEGDEGLVLPARGMVERDEEPDRYSASPG
jgi:hypothetical protein